MSFHFHSLLFDLEIRSKKQGALNEPLEPGSDARVAVLVDCDNATREILEFALRVVAQVGRVVVR